MHVDLFSRHARPLEFYVFVAVDVRGEDMRLCWGWQETRLMREALRVARIERQLWGELHTDNIHNH